jgi:hypothetical protein
VTWRAAVIWRVKLNRRLDRWEDQVGSAGANVCDCEEPCPPCARCGHAFCRHEDDGWLPRHCLSAGCDCRMWLSDSDCQQCDGMGALAPDSLLPAGQLTKDARPCPSCDGTGLRTTDDT